MTKRCLIRATGMARSGQLEGFGQALARTNAQLLDINQSVTFGMLSLEALVGLEHDNALEATLSEAGDALGLDVQAIKVNPDDYQRWSNEASQPRLILTLLAPHLPAGILAEVGILTAEFGLTVELIHRLSGRESLDGSAPAGGACVECWLRGDDANIEALREKALALGAEHGVDIAIQEDSIWRRHRRLVCFDMDSTLIETEVIDELADRAGVGPEVRAVTESAMRGEIDFTESFTRRIALLRGLDVSVMEEIARNLPITEGLERLMTILKRVGYKTAILSGGFTYFGNYLKQKYGFDYVYANELEVEEGRLTGRHVGEIVDGRRKAELLRLLCQVENINIAQSIAVGDGANDLPMLDLAGLGIAFHAKPKVKATASQSISTIGLDGVLYFLGLKDSWIE